MKAGSTSPSSPEPLDFILLLADTLGEEGALLVVRSVREGIGAGEDPRPWLRAVQIARDTGVLSADAAHYLFDVFVEEASARQIDRDAELQEASRLMDASRAAHGLADDEDFYVDEGPEDWQAARRRWEARFDQIRAEWFRRIGEQELAAETLFRPDEFMEATERGRLEVLGEDEGPSDLDGDES